MSKYVGHKKWWVQKNFESKITLGSNKFCVQKNLGSNSQKNGVPKKIYSQKNSGPKNLGQKKFGSGSKLYWSKRCLAKNILPNIFWVKSNLRKESIHIKYIHSLNNISTWKTGQTRMNYFAHGRSTFFSRLNSFIFVVFKIIFII